MESTGKKKKKKAPTEAVNKIKRGYVEYLLENGKKPASVYKFCKSLGIKEDVFYKDYGSLQSLEKVIWKDYITDTINRMKSDENYATFSAREKMLAFYFTLLEVMRSDRDFVIYKIRKWKLPAFYPSFLNKFRKEFDGWVREVLEEGKRNEEIATRPYLDKRYGGLFWFHLHFIIHFWKHDSSADFEKTDVAIEKSVNLAFDLIGKGVLDNAFDFGKFLFQQARD